MTAARADRLRLSLGCIGTVVALYCIFVLTGWGQRADNAAKVHISVHRYSRQLRSHGLPTVRQITSAIPIVAALIVTAAIALWAPKRQFWALWATLQIVVPAVLLCEAIKFALPHPSLTKYPDWIAGSTLPSGHVAFVSGLALSCFLLIPQRHRYYGSFFAAAMVLTAMVGVVIDGSHRPSDAAAAVAVVVGWFLFVAPRVAIVARTSDFVVDPTFMGAAIALGVASLALDVSIGFDDFPPTVATVDKAFAAGVLLAGATALCLQHILTLYFATHRLEYTSPRRHIAK